MNKTGMIQPTANNAGVEAMALRLAHEAPTLSNLSTTQLEQIAQIVLTQRLAGELNVAVNIAGIDYDTERSIFIDNAGHSDSDYTRVAYCSALDRFEDYADRLQIKYLAFSAPQADDYIYFLKSEDRAPASIRRDIAAVSAFFSFLERRYPSIKNPFRGTKARPAKKSVRETEIPSPTELPGIIENVPELEAAILTFFYRRGFRAGALPLLMLQGNRFTTNTKGKEFSGLLPDDVLEALKAAGLSNRTPFADLTVNAIELRIKYQMKKLYLSGKIKARYSCHDFRHYYAVQEYTKDKDIYRVSHLLGHSNIAITEVYLKSLGVIEI